MSYKGKYTPQNPNKYKGNPDGIIFRSLWERRLMVDLDTNPNVIEWSSEELIIPYISPKDGKRHRYFPDFVMKVKTMDNKIHTYLLEVKPKKETKPPIPKKRKTKQFLAEQLTFDINSAKWAAAERFCELHGWKFRIVTEDDLFPKRTKKK